MEGAATAIGATLLTGEPRAKVMAARRIAREWRLGRPERRFDVEMPDRLAARVRCRSGNARTGRIAGDETGARILERTLDDEIRHVAIGPKHLHETSLARGELPREMWQNLVKTHLRGALKPPFNGSPRRAAGWSRSLSDGVA